MSRSAAVNSSTRGSMFSRSLSVGMTMVKAGEAIDDTWRAGCDGGTGNVVEFASLSKRPRPGRGGRDSWYATLLAPRDF
jgi:hypothetical protein